MQAHDLDAYIGYSTFNYIYIFYLSVAYIKIENNIIIIIR
jgi:hypothetical protein